MIYTYMVKAYALLVRGGRMAISADDNKDNLQVVPESYQVPVAEYLANVEAAK